MHRGKEGQTFEIEQENQDLLITKDFAAQNPETT
uniref:Uncharacterized protein n=1 Tax=Rhizophora mucronata TaxID=61149 RepID=A0A2P2QW79_RHIMU